MNATPATLQGKTAIVTGAGQGIGLVTVQALSSAGARIICIDQARVGFDDLAKIDETIALQADVTDKTLPERLDALLSEHNLQLDILVNNAGIVGSTHALDTTDYDMQANFDVNVMGTFRLSRWAISKMMRTGGGAIVNVASIFGLVGAQNTLAYSTSKAAVIGLTRQMATDFGPNNIRVNAVAPGLIATPQLEDRIEADKWRTQNMIEQAPLRRVGKPIDVARAIRFLASEESSFITGQILEVDGGWAMGRFPKETKIEA